jgi:hypothetical protein
MTSPTHTIDACVTSADWASDQAHYATEQHEEDRMSERMMSQQQYNAIEPLTYPVGNEWRRPITPEETIAAELSSIRDILATQGPRMSDTAHRDLEDALGDLCGLIIALKT